MKEKEYIERGALVQELTSKAVAASTNASRVWAKAISATELAPKANVREEVTGHWVWDENAIDWGLGGWVCDKCHCRNHNIGAGKNESPYAWSGSKFCPNCGATMEKGGLANAL